MNIPDIVYKRFIDNPFELKFLIETLTNVDKDGFWIMPLETFREKSKNIDLTFLAQEKIMRFTIDEKGVAVQLLECDNYDNEYFSDKADRLLPF